ncbi:ISAzo13 family transposase [Methylobacter sp. S3L5C]|uniref:ISAzo13 family transposase n=1 Tax=Methylobacter sp. S3L5C TaxID=2839024 RepID=UPI001FAD86C5|nr:ISAzo13 family transposase [Methylobacter sp. S3L5C]
MQPAYPIEIEKQMQEVFNRLSEKDKRLYAGVEASKFPYGGISYIAQLFFCSRNTIGRGINELKEKATIPKRRDRKAGGGRKQIIQKQTDINDVFLSILKEHTAGDPMNEMKKWTNLTCAKIGSLLAEENFKVSRNIVRKLLKQNSYVKRKALKNKATGGHINRNAQFERIAEFRDLYTATGNPVLSVDSKKKELIGDLFREGKVYTTKTIEVFDHDFPSLAEGVGVPHTLYDIDRNEAYVNIGTSRDTSEFSCDSIRHWWYTYGIQYYPLATSILMLMDGGGSNSSRHYIFKQDLQALVEKIGIEIRIAHYPPYTSKWNPIEHLVFPHITRAMSGMVLTSHLFMKELIEKTTTKTGLKVFACIFNRVYETGRKVMAGFKESMRIVFDKHLRQWNYVAMPESAIL